MSASSTDDERKQWTRQMIDSIASAVQIGAYADGLGRLKSIEADLRAPGNRLNDAQQTVALRLMQEALQNVRKHAAATRATVTTRLEGDAWVLEIRDDGRGFDVGAVGARGGRNFGLQFMRERADLIGARFEVRSRPDGGTVVWLAIPLGEESR